MHGSNSHTVVCIGGIGIRLSYRDESFGKLLAHRYYGFINTSMVSEFQLDVEIVPDADFADPQASIQVNYKDGFLQMRRSEFEAEWDRNTGQGRVRQTVNPYSIDTIFRIIHGLIQAERGGFLLHAASAVRNDQSFVFSGLSGAGKTTISRLAPTDTSLLTDEISYIRQEKGVYFACGTPFSGELGKPGINICRPLKAVYLLAKGPENQISEVRELDAVRALMRNVLFFVHEPTLIKKVFDTVCDFVTRVEISRLTFFPDSRVWDLVK